MRRPNKQEALDAGMAVFAMIAFFFVIAAFTHKARAHDAYQHWSIPGLNKPGSCCNEKKTVDGKTTGDCYPTQARIVQGHWIALRDDGVWVDIPDTKIIHERNPGSEDAHLCYAYGGVICFVPPDTGG